MTTESFCNQTPLMERASGGIPGMLGSFSGCPANDNTQFCVLFPTESEWGNSRLLGYCLPLTCSLLQIAQHVVEDPLLNTTFRYSELINNNNTKPFISSPMIGEEKLGQYIMCTSRSDSSLKVKFENIISWSIIGFIVILVLLATFYDYYWKITSRSIPFEVVMMGSGGDVVRVLQSPNITTIISSNNENNRGESQFIQINSNHNEEDQLHENINYSNSHIYVKGISQPLLNKQEKEEYVSGERNYDNDVVIESNNIEGIENSDSSNVENIIDDVSTQSKPTKRRGSIFRRKEIRIDPISIGETIETTNSIIDENKTTREKRILPDFNTDALWSNKRVQKFLAEIPDVPDFRSIVNRAVLCLSLINSFRKWRFYPKSEANLNLFNSWRVIAWLWSMLFSTFWYSQQIPTMVNVGSRHHNFLYAFLDKEAFAGFIVGTFLIIAGFLALHRLHISEEVLMASPTARVRAARRTRGEMLKEYIIWYIKYLISRIVRVVPVTFAALALAPNVFPTYGNGPFWSLFSNSPALHGNCARYWWTNFILVNNIFPLDENERCCPWSYYVALEFQLVAIAPFIYFLGKKLHHRVFTALMLLAMIVSSLLRYFELTRQGTIDFTMSPISHYSLPLGKVYQYPHLMFIPFCAGALLYYLYRGVRQRAEMLHMFGPDIFLMMHHIQHGAIAEDKASYLLLEQLRKRRIRICIMWGGIIINSTCIISAWIVHRDDRIGQHISIGVKIYESLILFPWCLGLCLLALPLLFGYGGMFRRILIHRLWCGPSRLILVAYLLAPVIIGFGNASSYSIMTMNFLLFVVQWFGYTVATLLVAFVFHMLVERPCLHVSSRGEY